jgi:hypothetical protein
MGHNVSVEREAGISGMRPAGVIASDLEVMPAIDLITWLGNRARTGTLELSHGGIARRVSIEAGLAVRVRSSSVADSLAQFLLNAGAICAATLDEALVDCQRSGARLGYVLATRHGLRVDEVRRVVEHQIRELLLDAVRWSAGRMLFVAHAADVERSEVPAEVSLTRLREIAVSRAQHWTAFEAAFADQHSRWVIDDGALPRRTDPMRDYIVSLIRAGQPLVNLLRALPLTAYEVYARLYELARLGALRPQSGGGCPTSISPAEILLDSSDARAQPPKHAARPDRAAVGPTRGTMECSWTPHAASTLEATLSACRGPIERQLVRCLDGRRSIADLQALTSLSRDVVISVLIELAERGLVHL